MKRILFPRNNDAKLLSALLHYVHKNPSCWKCSNVLENEKLFCSNNACNALQPISLRKNNLFKLFNLNEDFEIDSASLNSSFKELQKVLHPDKFVLSSPEEKQLSNDASSVVNQAYEILKSPVSRAEYMIDSVFGISVFDESKVLCDDGCSDRMSEIFDIKEEIEEKKKNTTDLLKLFSKLNKEVVSYTNDFKNGIKEKDVNKSLQAAIHLKYYCKMVDDLDHLITDAKIESSNPKK
mmetsp:Transcript_13387/g.18340  ORF Transcript_13387/g.18340 Transcript_13387/m.18340 type:complete len:237 (+) Transcript_13387:46-756(+)